MIDSIMIKAKVGDARICTSFVCMDGRSDFDILMNSVLNVSLSVLDRHCDRSTAALAHPKNGRLADCAATSFEFLFSCLLASLPPT